VFRSAGTRVTRAEDATWTALGRPAGRPPKSRDAPSLAASKPAVNLRGECDALLTEALRLACDEAGERMRGTRPSKTRRRTLSVPRGMVRRARTPRAQFQ